MAKYILAIDQGTTSSRAIIFDRSGAIKSVAQKEFKQYYPQPGWVEHDAKEIWSTQASVIASAITDAGVEAEDIAALGITNQRETTVVWDKQTGLPVHHAIVWQDRRTSDFCDQLKDRGLEPKIEQKTGLRIDSYFSATKLKWLLDHVDGLREKAEQGRIAFGTVDSWLVWKLTQGKVHVTDVTNACRTMLYNIHKKTWDEEILQILDIPRSVLPQVRSCSEIYGETGRALFPSRIPIAGIAGDQQAALFGQMCTEPGMIKNTYGTGAFMILNTGSMPVKSSHNLLTTIAWQVGGRMSYALEGSIFIAGAVVQWLRDGLHLIGTSEEVERLAQTEPDNGGVYLVPAFAGLGAPHWDQYARGIIIGLTRGTTAGHIARAALESIAYQTRDVLEAMKADSDIGVGELRVDGGAAADDTLMQFQADILQIPIVRPKILETTALGAAYLAGLAVGYWDNFDEIKSQWQIDRIFQPRMAPDQVKQLIERWQEAVERAKAWIKPH